MRTALVELESISPYSQSKEKDRNFPRLDKESAQDHEERTWMQRCHYDEHEQLFIPPMAFKNCLSEAAKFLSVRIAGESKATYTKHFEAGILIMEKIPLPVRLGDVEGEWLFVPSQGRRGGGERVWKKFPIIQHWTGQLTVHIMDNKITADVFRYHFEQAGAFIGIGRFRPRKNGYYGRFKVNECVVQEREELIM